VRWNKNGEIITICCLEKGKVKSHHTASELGHKRLQELISIAKGGWDPLVRRLGWGTVLETDELGGSWADGQAVRQTPS
jgi:hypothetical protein